MNEIRAELAKSDIRIT